VAFAEGNDWISAKTPIAEGLHLPSAKSEGFFLILGLDFFIALAYYIQAHVQI